MSRDSDKGKVSTVRRRGSATLYRTTLLVILVFMLSGLSTHFIYDHFQNRLLDKGKAKLLQTTVDSACSLSSYSIGFLIYLGQSKLKGLVNAVVNHPDVEIPVRKGEELESLKHLFRKMVESFRMLIEKALLPNSVV